MKAKWRKILTVVGITTVVIGGAIAASTIYTIRRSFPQVSGTVELPNLQDKVIVKRDKWGIPHIYASNEHDLFMAQGYIHAQDRFWQMDYWRHLGGGRLSEMFGDKQLSRDKFLRTLGWERIAQQELQQLSPEEKATLEAYSAGVNAYLENRKGSELSLEYAFLNFLSSDYEVEPWTPIHTLTWSKVMAWDLGQNMNLEIERAILLKTLKPEQLQDLFPPYPEQHPVILPNYNADFSPNSKTPRITDPTIPIPSELLQSLDQNIKDVNAVLGETGIGIGSNSWVVSGERTATGKPMLANDPHLGVEIPSIWYEVGLHCLEKTSDCPYDVTGFSFAGVPGVTVGHNDKIAWGVTATQMDVMDLYIEKINPNNPNQYEVNGEWVDMRVVKETLEISGKEPEKIEVRYTRHGPIISDTFQGFENVNLPENFAIALRWTALEPSSLFSTMLAFNRAENWQEFREAAKGFDIAAQNLVYADVEGNIGYQMPGNVPIRQQGTGAYPVPGWTDEFAWQGYIPFEQLPFTFNPPQGYIATANNPIVGEDYPYLITTDWDYGYRAERIVNMIEGQSQPLSVEDFKAIQGDDKSLNAEKLVPILLNLSFDEERLTNAQKLLQNWDYSQGMDEAAPALFEMFWKHLLAETFHDNLPESYYPKGRDRWMIVVHNLLQQPNSFWWDDSRTELPETQDQIFQQAFIEAVNELEDRLGENPQEWRWGDLHTVTFPHQTLGQSGFAPLEAIFNRGAFAVSGGNGIVNANTWTVRKSFEVSSIPSMRMIIDLSDFSNSLGIHSTGQSGHVFHPHYEDMIDPWRRLEYHSMLGTQEAMEANTEETLTLIPE